MSKYGKIDGHQGGDEASLLCGNATVPMRPLSPNTKLMLPPRATTCPMLHVWAAGGTTRHLLRTGGWRVGNLAEVGQQCTRAGHEGRSLFPEENPTRTTELLKIFLSV